MDHRWLVGGVAFVLAAGVSFAASSGGFAPPPWHADSGRWFDSGWGTDWSTDWYGTYWDDDRETGRRDSGTLERDTAVTPTVDPGDSGFGDLYEYYGYYYGYWDRDTGDDPDSAVDSDPFYPSDSDPTRDSGGSSYYSWTTTSTPTTPTTGTPPDSGPYDTNPTATDSGWTSGTSPGTGGPTATATGTGEPTGTGTGGGAGTGGTGGTATGSATGGGSGTGTATGAVGGTATGDTPLPADSSSTKEPACGCRTGGSTGVLPLLAGIALVRRRARR